MDKEKRIKIRGEHCLNVFISHELKGKLKTLAERYDRTMADMVRAVLKVGVPMMEGISEAEEAMVREYIQLFRKFRKIKNLKEI
jgi:predicted DNA-binding protein